MRLYKFLNDRYAIEGITKRELKISRIDELNDPSEFLAANMENSLDASALLKFKQELIPKFGIVCFSKEWSSPVMWAHYADSQKGIVLGFEVAEDQVVEVRYILETMKVNYDQKARKIISSDSPASDLARTKFIDWQYEKEVRLFVSLTNATDVNGYYFTEFSPNLLLVEVILGSLCTVSVPTLYGLIKTNFPPGTVRLLKSKRSLKNLDVVEDFDFQIE